VGLWGRCYPLAVCEPYSLNCNGFSIGVNQKQKSERKKERSFLYSPRPQHIGTLQFHRACVLKTPSLLPPLPQSFVCVDKEFKKMSLHFFAPPAPNETLGTLQFHSPYVS